MLSVNILENIKLTDFLLENLTTAVFMVDKELKVRKVNNAQISIGITEKMEDKFEDVIKTADKLLYEAKENGRNRVVSDKENLGGIEVER